MPTWYEDQMTELLAEYGTPEEALAPMLQRIQERWDKADEDGEMEGIMLAERVDYFRAVMILADRWGLPGDRENFPRFAN